MNKKEIEHFEGIIFKAVQSGKKETSDLVTDILQKIEPIINKNLDKNFNGKIGRLDEKVTNNSETMKQYIERDDKWKEKIELLLKERGDIINYLVSDNEKTMLFISRYEGEEHDRQVEKKKKKFVLWDKFVGFLFAVGIAFVGFLLGKR